MHPVDTPRPRLRSRRGMALLVSMFLIIVLAIMGALMVGTVDLHSKSNRNVYEITRVQETAEAALAHAIGIFHIQLAEDPFNEILLGQNRVANGGTGDDGILQGSVLEIPEADAIPSAGLVLDGYRYTVRVTDDPGETDGDPMRDTNQRLLVTCTATKASGDGPSAEVRAIVERSSSDYRIMLDGPVTFTRGLKMSASCARGYINGAIDAGAAASEAGGGWFAPAGVTLPTNFTNTRSVVAVATIPSIAPSTLCTSYLTATSTESLSGLTGVRCYSGDVTITGTSSGANVTVVATGSITMTGGAIRSSSSTPGGISLVAGEDILLTGNAEVRAGVYCGGQFSMQGTSGGNGAAIYCRGLQIGSVVGGTPQKHVFNSSTSNNMSGGCGATSAASIGTWRFTTWYPGIGS